MIPGDRNNHKWPWRNASLRRRPSFHFLWSLAFLQRHHQKVMCKMKCEAQCASGSSKFLILCTATRAHQQQATIAFPSSHQHHVVVSFGVLMSRESRRWLNCFFFFHQELLCRSPEFQMQLFVQHRGAFDMWHTEEKWIYAQCPDFAILTLGN